ncbi:cobalt ECF transporter T component CbiQ [Crocosphaera sp. UHCC 0190]|uniref:cobalt ECF transporter T component CbiQ n=1 Tax=Crocosphaera sp. UHCC 0190 TaxID=3110246 RepID=UPI002B1F4C28|nr:cobalt ECF transporter T component CbiQ [Crocosphaera sp. UHCC 0190]MEA5509292.1 cobalt ECF transporter T component CbiQ [Crocosphaera sp. UHCC 0190]
MLLHIHSLLNSAKKQPRTFWHSLAPQTRLLCTLISVFAIALTPNGQWKTWGVYGLGVLITIFVSRVSLRRLLARVVIEFAFVGVVLLGTLFRPEGQVIWSWGILKITTTGVMVLGSVTLKVMLSLFVVNTLILTTSIPDLFQALLALRTPPLLVAIMASMYRYIDVLNREFTSMRRAAISRNLMSNPQMIRQVMGNAIGSLFIRSYERGELIYQAMLSRGYQGVPSSPEKLIYKKRDIGALLWTGIMVILGQIIHLI